MGNSAVVCFLFISGYYNFHLLSKYKFRSEYLLDRFLRLFPLYYFSFLILIPLTSFHYQNLLSGTFELLLLPKAFEFLMPKYIKSNFLNPVTWSLAVEFIIFLILPLILYYIREKNLKKILVIGIFTHIFLINTSIKYGNIFSVFNLETFCSVNTALCNSNINYIFAYKSIFPLILVFLIGYFFAKNSKDIKYIFIYIFSLIFVNNESRIDVIIGLVIFIPIAYFLIKIKLNLKFDKLFASLSYPFFLVHLPIISNSNLGLTKIYINVLLISLVLLFLQFFIDRYRYNLRYKINSKNNYK